MYDNALITKTIIPTDPDDETSQSVKSTVVKDETSTPKDDETITKPKSTGT